MEATRITEGSATLIDYIFANTYAMNAMGGNLVSQISDNLPQFLIVNHRICFFLNRFIPLKTAFVSPLHWYITYQPLEFFIF